MTPRGPGQGVFAERPGPLLRGPGRAPATGRTEEFIEQILEEEYGGPFRVRPPYRTMYQDEEHLIYFQNFNRAGTANLWYRLKGTAMDTLTSDRRRAYVVFTNPADRFAYLIPVGDLETQVRKVGWEREDLEVNIDPGTDRWRELEWDLSEYLRRFESACGRVFGQFDALLPGTHSQADHVVRTHPAFNRRLKSAPIRLAAPCLILKNPRRAQGFGRMMSRS